jgi:hypothetical protein
MAAMTMIAPNDLLINGPFDYIRDRFGGRRDFLSPQRALCDNVVTIDRFLLLPWSRPHGRIEDHFETDVVHIQGRPRGILVFCQVTVPLMTTVWPFLTILEPSAILESYSSLCERLHVLMDVQIQRLTWADRGWLTVQILGHRPTYLLENMIFLVQGLCFRNYRLDDKGAQPQGRQQS